MYYFFILNIYLNIIIVYGKYIDDKRFKNVIATPCGSFTKNNFDLGIRYACNLTINPNDMAVAISNYQYSKYVKSNGISNICNKKIIVKNKRNNKIVKVTIKDQYLNGDNGSLDLTPKAWNMINSKEDIHQGHAIVDWNWI